MATPDRARKLVLAPIDVQHDPERLLRWVAALALQTGADVFLQYATTPRLEEGMYLATLHDLAEELRQLGLNERGLVVDYGMDHRWSPARAIEERAMELMPDLIVQTTRGQESLRRWFQGSTTEAVIERTPFPVLAIPANLPPPSGDAFRRILVATDLRSAAPLHVAQAWSSLPGTSMTYLHVVNIDEDLMAEVNRESGLSVTPDLLMAQAEEAVRGLFVQHPELRPVGPWKAMGGMGSSVVEILSAILTTDYDLVITGHQHRSLIGGLLSPSTSREVLRETAVPVLVVPS